MSEALASVIRKSIEQGVRSIPGELRAVTFVGPPEQIRRLLGIADPKQLVVGPIAIRDSQGGGWERIADGWGEPADNPKQPEPVVV